MFVTFPSDFTIFEGMIPDNYYLHVLSLLTLGTSLKLGLMLWKQTRHQCNNVQWMAYYAHRMAGMLTRETS